MQTQAQSQGACADPGAISGRLCRIGDSLGGACAELATVAGALVQTQAQSRGACADPGANSGRSCTNQSISGRSCTNQSISGRSCTNQSISGALLHQPIKLGALSHQPINLGALSLLPVNLGALVHSMLYCNIPVAALVPEGGEDHAWPGLLEEPLAVALVQVQFQIRCGPRS